MGKSIKDPSEQEGCVQSHHNMKSAREGGGKVRVGARPRARVGARTGARVGAGIGACLTATRVGARARTATGIGACLTARAHRRTGPGTCRRSDPCPRTGGGINILPSTLQMNGAGSTP
jgi:hypothetical protein